MLQCLRDWRTKEVRRARARSGKRTPAFLVATDATLQALAVMRPSDTAALSVIPGLGPAKTAEYGESLLDLLASVSGSPRGV